MFLEKFIIYRAKQSPPRAVDPGLRGWHTGVALWIFSPIYSPIIYHCIPCRALHCVRLVLEPQRLQAILESFKYAFLCIFSVALLLQALQRFC